jgi:peptidoglycan/LPS O-acetylase OafA/YrhL
MNRTEITDLTICRAAFAAWVFIYHIDLYAGFSWHLGFVGDVIRAGYLGVDGFFVLSGMILARVHAEMEWEWGASLQFWGKRLARVYPVHLATIFVLVVFLVTGWALGMAPRSSARFTLGSLVENLLLIQGWGFSNFLAWNYPSWSVSTEWAGYLAFPVIWHFMSRWADAVIVPAVVFWIPVLGAVDYYSGSGLNMTYGGVLLRFFPEFLLGMATARMVPMWADEMPSRTLAFVGVAAVALFAWLGWDTLVVTGLWLLIYALAMQADSGREPVFGKREGLIFLGRLSYAFYMSFGTAELLVTQIFRHFHMRPGQQGFLFCAAMVVLTFAYAMILHVFVEVPARRAADRFLAPAVPLAGQELRL